MANKSKLLKKKEHKALSINHPNSRKAIQLARNIKKELSRKKSKFATVIKQNQFGEKLIWFRGNLEPGRLYTPEMAERLFEKYLLRFNEELEQIKLKHSIGKRQRQHASREDIIRMTISRETEEFNTAGIEMIDILDPKSLRSFRDWDEDLNQIQNFKIIRISKKYLANYKIPPYHLKLLESDIAERNNQPQESKDETNVMEIESEDNPVPVS